jgi:hypothetical protein
MPTMHPVDHGRLLVEVIDRDLADHGAWALLCIPGVRPLLEAWYRDEVQALWQRSQPPQVRLYPCVEERIGTLEERQP